MTVALRIIGFGTGAGIVITVIDAALRTFVLPRGAPVKLTRAVARAIRTLFDQIARPQATYERRDRVMALYGPVTLISFPAVWSAGVIVGFALMFRAATATAWLDAVPDQHLVDAHARLCGA